MGTFFLQHSIAHWPECPSVPWRRENAAPVPGSEPDAEKRRPLCRLRENVSRNDVPCTGFGEPPSRKATLCTRSGESCRERPPSVPGPGSPRREMPPPVPPLRSLCRENHDSVPCGAEKTGPLYLKRRGWRYGGRFFSALDAGSWYRGRHFSTRFREDGTEDVISRHVFAKAAQREAFLSVWFRTLVQGPVFLGVLPRGWYRG